MKALPMGDRKDAYKDGDDQMIAITGITGHTGGYFLAELINHQYPEKVRCLVRSTSNTEAMDNSGLMTEKLVGSIADEATVKELIHGVDTVMHITNIRYSLPILRAAIDDGVRRVVLVHTTGIYSKFRTASEEYKQIETKVDELLSKSNIDVTILRPTMIFGDLCDHNISKFIRMADKLPVMPEIDHGGCRICPVNARDLGRAYYQAVCASNLPELSYDVTGEKSITIHEMIEQINIYLGKHAKFVSVPMPIGIFCANAFKTVTLGTKDFVENVLRMGEDRDYPHDAATRDFGYYPEPFEVGLKREVEQYRAMKGRYKGY